MNISSDVKEGWMYKKIKVLGRGAFGLVYKAENLQNPNELVAIKKYIGISKKDIPFQILREINIIKLLKHPNIIGVIDVQNVGQNIELVLEYGGESLRSYYQKTDYNKRVHEIKNISYQLLMGCLYMHKLGVIHRDLKPDNVLIISSEPVPIVKLCDFGLAKKIPPFKNEYNSYQICTLQYRPPELFTTNNQNYGTAVDVWSLGCLLYEFVIGKPIFEGSTETVVLKNILSKIPITQEDLDNNNLEHIKLEACNNEKFYKLTPLYNIDMNDNNIVTELDDLKELLQSMLILDQNKRINLEKACKNKYFCEIEKDYKELISLLEANRVKYYQYFNVRAKLPKQIPVELRNIYIEEIISLYDHYVINEQAILIAINIFDQFICSKTIKVKEIIDSLDKISVCCLVLASKYIDLAPLNIKNFVVKYSETLLIYWERTIIQTINYDLNQPTLLNFYKELIEDKFIDVTSNEIDEIPFEHWKIIKEIILDYDWLQNKGIQEIKEHLLYKIKNK